MERTLDAMLAEQPDQLEQIQAQLVGLEQKTINEELYFINHEKE